MTNQKLADLWSTSPVYAEAFQPENEISDTLDLLELRNSEALVDNGCGNGAFSVAAACQYPHCQVFACDALSSAIDECVSRAGDLLQSNLSVAVAPANHLPLPDNFADRALSRFVLHHIGDPKAMFLEMRRILRPDSLFLLQAPCNVWEPEMASTLRQVFHAMDPSHARYYYQPNSIETALNESGFTTAGYETRRFSLPNVSKAMAEIIREHQVEHVLKLQPTGTDRYTIELAWIRVIARG